MSFLEAVKESEWLISRGYELEALGRKLAADREAFISGEDIDWADDVVGWHFRAYEFCERLTDSLFTEEEATIVKGLTSSSSWMMGFFHEIYRRAIQVKARRKSKFVEAVHPLDVESIVFHLESYDSLQSGLSGRSGIWLYKRVMTLEEYTFSAFLNDCTSCFHQFLNWLNRKIGSVKEVDHRVYVTPDATPITTAVGTAWREAVEVYVDWGLYAPNDYEALYALCRLNDVEFRVGSSPGHATHVAVRPLVCEASYYDVDEEVHFIFWELCKHYRCRVLSHEAGDVTVVAIPRTHMSDFLQGVLPFTTSMDLRLKNPTYYWGPKFRGELEKMEGFASWPREFRLCLKAYERFLKERR